MALCNHIIRSGSIIWNSTLLKIIDLLTTIRLYKSLFKMFNTHINPQNYLKTRYKENQIKDTSAKTQLQYKAFLTPIFALLKNKDRQTMK